MAPNARHHGGKHTVWIHASTPSDHGTGDRRISSSVPCRRSSALPISGSIASTRASQGAPASTVDCTADGANDIGVKTRTHVRQASACANETYGPTPSPRRSSRAGGCPRSGGADRRTDETADGQRRPAARTTRHGPGAGTLGPGTTRARCDSVSVCTARRHPAPGGRTDDRQRKGAVLGQAHADLESVLSGCASARCRFKKRRLEGWQLAGPRRKKSIHRTLPRHLRDRPQRHKTRTER